ncbi:autotransporter assembly complex family protein [Glaciecola sp. KUL10]|uniref:autotransporter assembly complex protein TamA n=1 Tax=Glaciecola sp. (strain KUL10) TaxID=2161813 RepID=UPI000D8F4D31|nr:BamA/TamA family outer membrane protein [Glaciecola sp. KUL10]GBL05153.1 surface antigen (D15) [Glaciecola sp. KUL10]
MGAKQENDWNKVISIKYEREDFTQGFAEQQQSELLVPGFSLNRVRKNDDIFVTNGDRQLATIEGASDALLSDINLAKITLSTKWIRTFDKHRWIARADVGALTSSDFESVPSSLRFFAGGDQSIRGFGLDELGQTRLNENGKLELIGGRYLNVASIEYAYSVSDKWRAAIFADAGGANAKFADEIAKGFGAGVHWLSPVGTIRLYLARGISGTERNWRVHFSIGPGL